MPKSPPGKILLSSIKSLTFFADEYTRARRTDPIPQLTCIGKICDLFQPQAVLCSNIGGRGTSVNWKCEADLPSQLRFGKVTVSCEGWSGPGDEQVLEGSCGLEYRLLRIPETMPPSMDDIPFSMSRIYNKFFPNNLFGTLFNILWLAILIYFAYLLYKSCISAHREANGPRGDSGNRPRSGPRGPGSWGSDSSTADPPPPYTQSSKGDSSTFGRGQGWTPGFWTGLGLGGLGASIWNSFRDADGAAARRRQQQQYDWERERERQLRAEEVPVTPFPASSRWSQNQASSSQASTSRSAPVWRQQHETDSNRAGSSSSDLGEIRRSTALASSNVR